METDHKFKASLTDEDDTQITSWNCKEEKPLKFERKGQEKEERKGDKYQKRRGINNQNKEKTISNLQKDQPYLYKMINRSISD